jgi:Protein of unknown function (DUF2934)
MLMSFWNRLFSRYSGDAQLYRNVMAIDTLWRIRQRSYQIWEQQGRPEGRHLDHWLQAEHELAADLAFEFKQLMRAFRSGIISEITVEQAMTDLEKRALSGRG